jgi:hypothetical protein
MLNDGKKGPPAKRSGMQADSSEDLGRHEFEEGKSVSLGEMSLHSP